MARKPLLFARKRSLLGSNFGRYHNLRTNLAVNPGRFIELGGQSPLLTATVEDSAKSNIVLTFNDTVTATTAATGHTYSVNGGADTVPTAVIAGSVLTLTMTAPIVYGDTVTWSYDDTGDMAIGGEQLEAITDSSVTNNVTQEVTAMVAPFYGYPETNITGITINSIFVADTNQTAPMTLMLSASDVSAVGTRNLTINPINPYQDIEYSWLITHADDSPIEDLEGIINPITGASVNPYTDQISPECTAVLREHGDYKITLQARGQNGTSNAVITNESVIVTVNPSVAAEEWVSGVGSDANDGLDAWGFPCVAAGYTESSGELTEVGVFTSYDHDVSMNITDRANFVYINGFGLRKIASKLSNDTIVLADKLGSDQTGLTTSTGAHLTTDWLSPKLIHLEGGHTYSKNGNIELLRNIVDQTIHIASYGGTRATVNNSDGLVGTVVMKTGNGSSGKVPADGYSTLSNIIIDGQDIHGPIGGAPTTTASGKNTYLMDRCDFINNRTINGIDFSNSSETVKTHWTTYAGYVDNLYTLNAQDHRQGIYVHTEMGGLQRLIGTVIDADCLNSTLDHYYYPSGWTDHFHCAYMHARHGTGANYAINTNNGNVDTFATVSHLSINDCMFDGNSLSAIDFGSGGSITAEQSNLDNIVVTRNKGNCQQNFLYFYKALNISALYNEYWTNVSLQGDFFNQAQSDDYYLNYRGVVYGNKSYGAGLTDLRHGEIGYEVSNNQNFSPALLVQAIYHPNSVDPTFYYDGNNMYSPTDPLPTVESVGTGGSYTYTDKTLAEFNTVFSATNISEDPLWNDPANGDFSPASASELNFSGLAAAATTVIFGMPAGQPGTPMGIGDVFKCTFTEDGVSTAIRYLMYADQFNIRIVSTDTIRIAGFSEVTIDGNIVVDTQTIPEYLGNGEHELIATISVADDIETAGSNGGYVDGWDGIIKNISLTIGGLETIYNIDSGKVDGLSGLQEVPSLDNAGIGNIEYINTTEDDWS